MREYPVIRSQVGMNGPMCVDLALVAEQPKDPTQDPSQSAQVSSQNRSSVFH
jgi:hypothetical protein